MSFLKQIVNERKQNREKEEFISRVAEKYNCSKELITETYDKALSETNSKVMAKSRVFSMVVEAEEETWGVWDRHDKKWVGGTYKNKNRARARVDRLDNEYGGYRYTVKSRSVNEAYDPDTDDDWNNSWNFDYAEDTGWSAQCPNCGSDEVMYDDPPPKFRLQAHRFECQECGTKGPWMGPHEHIATKYEKEGRF